MKRDRDDVIYIRAAAFEGLHGAELVLRAHQQQLRLARTACRLGSQVRGVEHVERRAQPCGSLGPVPHFCTGGFCIFFCFQLPEKKFTRLRRGGETTRSAPLRRVCALLLNILVLTPPRHHLKAATQQARATRAHAQGKITRGRSKITQVDFDEKRRPPKRETKNNHAPPLVLAALSGGVHVSKLRRRALKNLVAPRALAASARWAAGSVKNNAR